MNQELIFALQTLRYRSLISEALLAHVNVTDARAQQVIGVCRGSADVVEHIAQDVLEGQYHKAWLLQELSDALLLLDDFSVELAHSPLEVPSRDDIQALLTQISDDGAQSIDVATVESNADFGLDNLLSRIPTPTLNLLLLGAQEQQRINEAAACEQWLPVWHNDPALQRIGELAVEHPPLLCDAILLLLDGWFSHQCKQACSKALVRERHATRTADSIFIPRKETCS